jgi:hypothetical protein
MDAQLSVSVLQERSEQLRKLSTELSADLSKLRLALIHAAADSASF